MSISRFTMDQLKRSSTAHFPQEIGRMGRRRRSRHIVYCSPSRAALPAPGKPVST
jgi:hypothetical protein